MVSERDYLGALERLDAEFQQVLDDPESRKRPPLQRYVEWYSVIKAIGEDLRLFDSAEAESTRERAANLNLRIYKAIEGDYEPR